MGKFIEIGAPPAPGNNATVTLFDSTEIFPAGMHQAGVTRILLDFGELDQASAADGLKGYRRHLPTDAWTATKAAATGSDSDLPATVAADTGSDGSAYSILVTPYNHFKLTYTAGAAGPTKWPPGISVQIGDPASGV